MNKRILIIITILVSSLVTTFAQEKGLYLSLSGNYGANTIKYTLDNKAKSGYPTSWGAGLDIRYYFTKHWGISLGFEWFDYNGKAKYGNDWKNDPKHYETTNMEDNGLTPNRSSNYNLRLTMSEWTESQHAYVINIPLMAQYQTKWGGKEMVGMYFAAGVKFQIPVLKHNYTVNDGNLLVQAYYPQHDLTLPDEGDDLWAGHALGTAVIDEGANTKQSTETPYSGIMKLKPFSVAIAGELGLLFSFSRRVDLAVGAYLDYGLMNIKLRDAVASGKLIIPIDEAPTALNEAQYAGDGLTYNGFLQSSAVQKAKLFAFGGKATLRIKLGKLQGTDEENEKSQQKEEEQGFYKKLIKGLQDTVVDAIKDNTKCCQEGQKKQSEEDSWNPTNPDSKNNPNNPLYSYPRWYVPDYIMDSAYTNKRGLGQEEEGPNNPAAVKRNQQIAQEIENFMLEPIYFDLDKYNLRDSSTISLDKKVALMKKYPRFQVALIGHTCDLGSNSHNDELSSNRTISARNYMIRHGITARRLELIPMGKHHPDYPNISEPMREKNRRVDFIIVN